MNANIEESIRNNDIKGLRIIFTDCLDVDPTFDKYRDGYEAAKNVNGFLEDNIELTPLKMNESEWTKDYYYDLKFDLSKNFSELRFLHTINVAKVVFKEKVERLIKKRNQKTFISTTVIETDTTNFTYQKISPEENKQLKEEERIKELTLQNDKKYKSEIKEIENRKKLQNELAIKNLEKEDNLSKKAIGIVLILISIIILTIKQYNPKTAKQNVIKPQINSMTMQQQLNTNLGTHTTQFLNIHQTEITQEAKDLEKILIATETILLKN